MYDMPAYKDTDETRIEAFIHAHPFAFISGCDAAGKPVATQAPVFIEQRGGRKVLSGHIMKNTDHHKAFCQNNNVLVVFTGAHCYVSATWYSNPNVASTWNFMSVHARGRIRFFEGEAREDALRKVSLHFEGGNIDSPTFYDNLPEEFKRRYVPAIVGFEVEIEDLRHVFKLSQDRDRESYANIIAKLKGMGEAEQTIAREMEVRMGEVFGRNG